MSVSSFMAFDHNSDDDTGVKVSKVKQKSFWNGFLQGFSGPAMLADRPHVMSNLVEVRDNKIFLKLAGRNRVYALGSHAEAMEVARALSQATSQVMEQRGLKIGTESIRRLDQNGKMRELKRTRVQRREEDGSQ